MEAKSCVDFMLRGCDYDTQMSVVDTYLDIECLAKDVCSKPDGGQVAPVETPVECIDPMVVGQEEGATCNPLEAYSCLWDFKLKAINPFAMDTEKTCL